MKIDLKTIAVIAVVVYLLSRKKENPSIAGFYDSGAPFNPNHPGPLKPYGARWGNPSPSIETSTKAKMIV